MLPESQGPEAQSENKNTRALATKSVTVERVVFRNDANGYTVATVAAVDAARNFFTIVGKLPPVGSTDRLEITGRWSRHPRYGRQFQVVAAQLVVGKTGAATAYLLGSGLIPQVGPVLAQRIVDTLGPGAMQQILADPQVLTKVPGIGPQRTKAIAQALPQQAEAIRTVSQLSALGVPANMALRLYEQHGAASVDALKGDPYGTCLALPGIGFATADNLVARLGLVDPGGRLQALIQHLLDEAAQRQGHTCLPQAEAQSRAAKFLAAELDNLEAGEAVSLWQEAVAGLAAARSLVVDGERLYLPSLWQAETDLLHSLERLLAWEPGGAHKQPVPHTTSPPATTALTDGLAQPLALAEESLGLEMTARQRQAVTTALTAPMSIITGGPGTGKTTVVSTILATHAAGGNRDEVHLAAPTGRAAHRLAELTGHDATTIHRLLEYGVDGAGETGFRRHADHPLKGSLLIVDEASMLDLPLAANLFQAVPQGMRVVLIGDTDQLPSVGPGNVLGDLIAAQVVPVVHLDEIFRQSEASSIVVNAHRVRDGRRPLTTGSAQQLTADFRLLVSDTAEEAANMVLATVKELIDAQVVDVHDIQVLVPVWRGPVGVHELNARLQAALNPPRPGESSVRRKDRDFRVGDRVMCTRNLYMKGSQGIFNGHVGMVKAIEGDVDQETLRIEFDGELVDFGVEELTDLELAYACTVHKAQGSEFEAVIIAFSRQHKWLLSRNLLYTAMTRARRWLVLVTEGEAVATAVTKERGHRRHTALDDRLRAHNR